MNRTPPMRLAVAAVALVVASPAGAAEAVPDCGTAALLDYSHQIVVLSQAPESQPIPSVEAVIAKRRLQEAYCLRVTHCFLGRVQDMAFRAEFGRCISEEAEQSK